MSNKQPGSKFCFICGRQNPISLKLEFFSPAQGEVRSSLNVSEQYQGYPGVVHGGVIAAILDETGGRAHMTDPSEFMVTAQLNVRYRKPVPTGKLLVARGFAGEKRGRVSHAHSEIVNEDGEVLAEAELVLVDLPESQLAEMDAEALGWQVYPDKEAI